MNETSFLTQVKMHYQNKLGALLFRNNKGVLYPDPCTHPSNKKRGRCKCPLYKRGRPVRFGLCNESPAVGKEFRSADLIGVLPYTVEPEDVGKQIGVFFSVEVKKAGARVPKEHREGQARWAKLLNSEGADARIITVTEGPLEKQW